MIQNPFNYLSLATALPLVLALILSTVTSAQDTDDEKNPTVHEIETILRVQAESWNEGNLDGFMETYWKSPELSFSSGGKTTHGWQATMNNYKRKYPAGNMGHLTFDHLETTVLGKDHALVLGQWHLKYDTRKMDGNFSLVVRRMDAGWKIIHDHSSILEPEKSD